MKIFELINKFEWLLSPLNNIYYPIIIGLIYLFICLLHYFIYGSNPKKSNYWNFISFLLPYHNIFLSIISLIMLIGCIISVINESIEKKNIEWLICDYNTANSNGSLGFWAYLYYLSKYYELIDTFLQLIRGKYPPHYILHAYHHSLVILMSWMWLEYSPSLRFVGLMFNTLVHVVMYYYFYLKSINIEPWWKNYVTTLQIIQFVTSLILFCITLYYHFRIRPCNGMNLLYLNGIFNVTLLFGFVDVLGKGKKKGKKIQ